ncbi:MAG: precorrin-2 C(20)-methyltransferase [Cellulosilyticaceae bacterium]
MKGILYGVGVGPGDPQLMTYKAVEVIKKCKVIAVPKSGDTEQVALRIAKEHIADQLIVDCYMPMIRDQEALDKQHDNVAKEIKHYLDEGMDVAFLTLGDPSIYSTYIYIHKRILKMGYEARLIPGVPSICAVAAKLNDSLCEGGDSLHIIPASYKEDYLKLEGTKVLMKTGHAIKKVKEYLKEEGVYNQAKMVECCGMATEKIHHSLDSVSDDGKYFSVIVVKEEK